MEQLWHFTGKRGNSMAQVLADMKTGTVAKLIEQGQNGGKERAFFGLHEQAQQSRGLQAESERRPAARGLIDQHMADPALQGERQDRHLTGIEVLIGGEHIGQASWLLDGDEFREAQSAKAMIDQDEPFKLRPHRRRREHAAEQRRPEPILTQPGEI